MRNWKASSWLCSKLPYQLTTTLALRRRLIACAAAMITMNDSPFILLVVLRFGNDRDNDAAQVVIKACSNGLAC